MMSLEDLDELKYLQERILSLQEYIYSLEDTREIDRVERVIEILETKYINLYNRIYSGEDYE